MHEGILLIIMGRTKASKGAPSRATVKKAVTGKKATKGQVASAKQSAKNLETKMTEDETAYERLLKKVQENKRKATEDLNIELSKSNKRMRSSQPGSATWSGEQMQTSANLVEDDNFVTYDVTGDKEEFPLPSDDDESDLSDSEVTIAHNSSQESSNNNVVVARQQVNTERETNPKVVSTWINQESETRPNLMQMLTLMQDFMVKKGIINSSMDEREMMEFLETGQVTPPPKKVSEAGMQNSSKNVTRKDKPKGKSSITQSKSCPLEVMIYRKAVKQAAPQLGDQIEKLLNKAWLNVTNDGKVSNAENRRRSSSDEQMDTSDESDLNLNIQSFLDNIQHDGAVPSTSRGDEEEKQEPEKTPDELASELIVGVEKAKARMFEVSGKVDQLTIAQIDEDYQMIDAHIDVALRKKIINIEYVDFAKLLAKGRSYGEDEQRLELVNKNGVTFLTTASSKDDVQIVSYFKWEQAFRIYSNVLTSKFPNKSTELLQYHHTIHTASMAYVWENVYAYDKEFRQHIGRHPMRAWNVILQQAWTMLLKDRLKQDNMFFQRGPKGGNKGGKEICKCFNRGKCTFGSSCKFDHRCAIPKCNKFGHGAHICHLRDDKDKDENKAPKAGIKPNYIIIRLNSFHSLTPLYHALVLQIYQWKKRIISQTTI